MSRSARAHGFSLLEVIVTLVLAGLLASAALTYFDTTTTNSALPFIRMQNATHMGNAMEAICRDYEALGTKSAADLAALAAKVNSFSANYGSYCSGCTAQASTATVGGLNNALLVKLTNAQGESTYHLFTVQDY